MSAFRAAATSGGNGTAISVAAPTGTVAGDVVLVAVNVNGTVKAITDNNGATPFTEDFPDVNQTSTGNAIAIFSRRIQSGDPTTYNFTQNAASQWRATAITIQSPHASVIYDIAPTANIENDGTALTCETPAMTGVQDMAIMYQIFLPDHRPQTFSVPPTGYTQRSQASDSGSQAIAVYELVKFGTGNEASQQITYNQANGNIGVSLAIEPSAAAVVLPPKPSISHEALHRSFSY